MTNTLILDGSNQQLSVGFDADVQGSAGEETLLIEDDANVSFTPQSGDRVDLAQELSNYTIARTSLTELTLTDSEGGEEIKLTVNTGQSFDLRFADGNTTVNLNDNGEITVGDQALAETGDELDNNNLTLGDETSEVGGDEPAPQLNIQDDSFSIAEDAANGDVVGTVQTSGTVDTLAIASGNADADGDGNNAFSIAANGDITVNDTDDILDSGASEDFSLTVEATGDNGATATGTIAVDVTSVAQILSGTNGNDSLLGGGGDDTIEGSNGNDSIDGGDVNENETDGDLLTYETINDEIKLLARGAVEKGEGAFGIDQLFGSSNLGGVPTDPSIETIRGNSNFTDPSAGDVNSIDGTGSQQGSFAGVDLSNQTLEIDFNNDGAADGSFNVQNFVNVFGTENDDGNIIGDDADNILGGNNGNETLTGNAGEDTFVFNTAAGADGDSVTDFTSGEDTIDVQDIISGDFSFQSVADASGSSFAQNDLVFNQANSDLLGFLSAGSASEADFTISLAGGDEPVADDIAGAVGAGGGSETVSVTADDDGTTLDAANADVTFDFAQDNYNVTVDGFDTGDVLDFFGDTTASVSLIGSTQTSGSDGEFSIEAAAGGSIVQVDFTGVDPADDAQITGISSFNSVFSQDGEDAVIA